MNEVLKLVESNAVEVMSKQEIRDIIAKIEDLCRTGEVMDIPLTHHFSKSVYAREITFPKGTVIVGKIHKHQNLNILSSGEVSVLSIDGIKRVKAPHTFVASPGAKRVIFAHEDTVWTTIHGTDETDLEKLEDEFIAKTYDEVVENNVIDVKETLCLG